MVDLLKAQPWPLRIYALKNQDGVIRIEMRLRYYQLTQQTLSAIEQKLTMKQLVALRFAGDDELVSLINQTINEISHQEK